MESYIVDTEQHIFMCCSERHVARFQRIAPIMGLQILYINHLILNIDAQFHVNFPR